MKLEYGHRPADPADYLGVWKRLEDVPPRYRLENEADRYDRLDAWSMWERYEGIPGQRERARKDSARAGRWWAEYISEETDAPHYALCTPADFEGWLRKLCTETIHGGKRSLRTVQRTYSTPVRKFYDYLLTSVNHPHRYSPVLMAFADPGNEYARRVWAQKLRRDERPEDAAAMEALL